MNNFSSYQGLPNLSYIVADDLDIANLEVDTINVNVELQTDNIQPLSNTSDIVIGTNTNTGIIDFQQNVDVNGDLESDNITVNTQLNTDNMQPLTNTSNIVIGTNTNTGIIDIQQDVDVNGDITGDTITANTKIKTDLIETITSPTDLIIGNVLNTSQIIHYQDTSIFNRLGINPTYPLTTYNCGLTVNEPTGIPTIKIIDEDGGYGCIIYLLRGDYDFGADSFTDWSIENDQNGIFYIRSATSGTTTSYLAMTSGAIEIFQDIKMTAGKILYANRIEPISVGNAITLYSNSTGTLSLGNSASANNLTIRNNTVLDTGKNLTLSTTGIVSANTYRGVAVGDAIVLFDTSTSTFNIGNTSNTNIIRFNQRVSIGTNSNTRQLNVSNEQNATVNNYLQLLNTAQTTRENGIHIRNQNAGVFANEWFLYTPANSTDFRFYFTTDRFVFTSGGVLDLTTLSGMTTSTAFNLGESGDTGIINCNRSITMASNRTITMNTNANIFTDRIRGTTDSTSISLFATTTTATIDFATALTTASLFIATAQTSGNVVIGNTTPASDLGTLTINKNTVIATGKSLTLSTTSDLKVNSIQPINVADAISLYTTSTGNITVGNGANVNNILFNQNVSLGSKKLLCLTYTSTSTSNFLNLGESGDSGLINVYRDTYFQNKVLYIDSISALTPTASSLGLYQNATTSDITIGSSQTTGFTTLGGTVATTGTVRLQPNTEIAFDKILYVSKLNFSNYKGSGSTVELYNDITTTGAVNIMSGQTTAHLNLGNASATTGRIKLLNPNIESGAVGTNISLYGNTTTGSVSIMGGQTTGNLNLGNASATTGRVKFLNSSIESNAVSSTTNLFNNQTTGSINFATGLTTGSLTISSALTTGKTIIGNASATPPTNDGSVQLSGVVRILNDASSFFNTDSGTNLFRTVALQGKQLTNTMWAAAPTSVFAVWESNADNEACFIAQNGDSTIICNPGDQSAIWFLDEDVLTSANNYAWVGFRMSTAGVITASSDRRIKRDIQPVVKENLLETLSKIRIVNYKKKAPTEEQYYKNGKLRRKYQEVHMGVIAQDVKQAGLGEVVDRENEDSYFTVKYQDLSYYFHMGTQELIKENIALKEKVNKLENFIKSKFSDYE